MRNDTLKSQNYDLKAIYEEKFEERVNALAQEMHEAGIPYVWFTQVASEDDHIEASVKGSYGSDSKETGFLHDLLIDLVTSHSGSAFEYSLLMGLKAIEQLKGETDYVVHDNGTIRQFVMMGMISPKDAIEQYNSDDHQEHAEDEEEDVGDLFAEEDEEGESEGEVGSANAEDMMALLQAMLGGGADRPDSDEEEDDDWTAFEEARANGAEDGTPELCGVCPRRTYCDRGREVLGLDSAE